MLDPKVFKAYDVRGLYGSELDEEGAYAIGRAYVEQFEPATIAVGHDMSALRRYIERRRVLRLLVELERTLPHGP